MRCLCHVFTKHAERETMRNDFGGVKHKAQKTKTNKKYWDNVFMSEKKEET